MLPHDGPVNWLLWMRSAFAVTSSDAILWKAAVGIRSFGVGVLSSAHHRRKTCDCGGTGQEADWIPIDLIEAEQVSIMQFVPSVLGQS